MPQTMLPPEPPSVRDEVMRTDEARAGDTVEPDEAWIVLGRPIEDRSFEAVEAGMGLIAGLAIGTAVAGPIGTAVGGLVGIAAGALAGEALERAVGPVATTTDATAASTRHTHESAE